MNRLEPPSLATWMLEHLTPAGRDEALAGDLLEVYRTGRSNGWYWRQVIAACAVAWFRSLRTRLPLLVFALLWSALAPAWIVLVARIDSSPRIADVLRIHWPLAAAMWTGLNGVFLGSGLLVCIGVHASLRKSLHRRKALRAFLLAPVLFLPAYAATFVLTNLLWYPGIGIHWRALAPLAEIVDVRMWADALRIPFLIALSGALWGAIPAPARAEEMQPVPVDFSATAGATPWSSNFDSFTASRFLTLTVAAGLINAMIMSFLLLRLPESHAPSLTSLCMRAVLYVTFGALAGVAGSWFYWRSSSSPFRNSPPLPFSLFALVCVAAWVWIPSMVLFSEQVSAAAAFVAMIGAFVLAAGLRSATRAVFAPTVQAASLWEYNNAELFAESLYHPPLDVRGYGIAIAIYAAGWALATHSNYTAAILLACSAFLFTWERTAPLDRPYESRSEYKRSAWRLARVILPAVLLTLWALLDGVASREHRLAAQAAHERMNATGAAQKDHDRAGAGLSGYESIVLWPLPLKQKILAPLPPGTSLLRKNAKQPLVLRFTGAYWYFQPPDREPGPRALQTHGTPLAADIRANNALPLLMEAHQNLSAPVRLASCREIQVTVENRGKSSGLIAMALLLTDSSAPGKPALYLGQQPILSSQSESVDFKFAPAEEDLHFFIPAHANIRAFDTMTIMFFPETGSFRTAPQIAIDQFSLIPR